MRQVISRIFNDRSGNLPLKVIGLYTILIAANIVAWAWAIVAFRHHPVLLGTALLAYSFGLRHAVDADHIAAIDNVTRKLMQESGRSLSASSSRSGTRPSSSWPPSLSRLQPPPSRARSTACTMSAASSAPWSRRCSCS
jgi:hypothetical protein